MANVGLRELQRFGYHQLLWGTWYTGEETQRVSAHKTYDKFYVRRLFIAGYAIIIKIKIGKIKLTKK